MTVDDDNKIDIGEMDPNEHIRFSYTSNLGPSHEVRLSNPHQRMDDGILLTFRHRSRTAEVPTTDLKVQATFWKQRRWRWIKTPRVVRVPPNSTATFEARIRIPRSTGYGMYQGSIVGTDGYGSEVVIPVSVAVAASGPNFTFGGRRNRRALYDNGSVFGYTDYNWRAESGDWRFFYFDVGDLGNASTAVPYVVVKNSWQGAGTDIDTIVLGPQVDDLQPVATYGPYTLSQVGRSTNTYRGSGRWAFQTSSGGSEEVVSARITQEGLHALLLHQVRVDGTRLRDRFSGTVGTFKISPEQVTSTGSGATNITLQGGLAFSEFDARGFGLGPIDVFSGNPISQDDPSDPLSASFVRTVTLNNALSLEVSTSGSAGGSDLDLYLYDSADNLIAASTTPTDQESVAISFPPDGTYTIRVLGWSVPSGTDTFDLSVLALQGNDVSVIRAPGSIVPGQLARVSVAWDTTGKPAGTYVGAVVLGPPEAPALFRIPLQVTVP